jgi:hypothetical protein
MPRQTTDSRRCRARPSRIDKIFLSLFDEAVRTEWKWIGGRVSIPGRRTAVVARLAHKQNYLDDELVSGIKGRLSSSS